MRVKEVIKGDRGVSKDKIIFVYVSPATDFYALDGRQDHSMSRRPQLGFQYLCSSLEAHGYRTDIIDQNVTPFTPDSLVDRLKAEQPLYVGIYTVDALMETVPAYVRHLKKHLPDLSIVIGGPGTLLPDPYLQAGSDLVCIGEGEVTVVEMAEYFQGQREKSSLKGVCWLENGRKFMAPTQVLVEDLDALPFPDRTKTSIDAYYDYYIYNMQTPFAVLMASRGCAYQCTFCTSHEIWQGRVRFRSPANVVAEIEHLVDTYGVRYLNFADDVFGLKAQWTREFCERLIAKKLPVRWMCNLHPFSFHAARDEIMELMRQAGCDCVVLGLQSADPQVLKNIRRKANEPNSAKLLIDAAKKRGMLTAMGYIFGLPGDTRESIDHTVNYVFDCKPHHAEFYVLKVLHGSEIDRSFPARNMTALSENELWNLANSASRRFYTRPGTIGRNVGYVLRHRPSWLLHALRRLPSILRVTGISKLGDRFWGGLRKRPLVLDAGGSPNDHVGRS